jgi:[acyl-carrier-protein] S-malonyltransferase
VSRWKRCPNENHQLSANTYILCPGQGAQVVGMGKDFHDASNAVRHVFDTANEVLGFDLGKLCFEGPAEQLNQTDISQPAIYTTSVAAFRAVREAGKIDPARVTAYAGLSLGEYTALHLAGAFTFEEGLKLVAARGRYMQEAAVATPSSMVAILGAEEPAVVELCAKAAQGEVLVPANFNAPGQIVVSGSKGACERVLAEATNAGVKATPLVVAGAFHSPLMQPAAGRMRVELDKVNFRPLTTTVYSNVTAEPHGDAESIKEKLIKQIVAPVQWAATMKTLVGENGGEGSRFVELAPGRTLAGLAKRINRRLPIESFAAADALKESAQ